jgi:hygromycin-B 7''-O-kinase
MNIDSILPKDPSYELACDVTDNKDLEFWRPLIEHIGQLHDIGFSKFYKINGWANALFVLDEKLVIKVTAPNWGDDAKRELEALNLLSGQSLPTAIPQLHVHGNLNGWVYMIMDKLPGTNLHDIWSYLSKKNQCTIIKQVAHFAKQLNQIPVPASDELYRDWPTFLKEQTDSCYERRKKQGLTGPLLADLMPFIESVNYQPTVCEPCFIHCDLHPGNLLAEKKDGQWHLSGVIDFGDALISTDVNYELTASTILMALGNKTLNRAFLSAYGVSVNDDEKRQFQQNLMVLSLIRHSGQLSYLLEKVPGCDELNDWQSVTEQFFAL